MNHWNKNDRKLNQSVHLLLQAYGLENREDGEGENKKRDLGFR